MEDITQKFKEVKAKEIPPSKLAQINKEKSVQFKASLIILLSFYFWVTYVTQPVSGH